MPIITIDGLPINDSLRREGVFGMPETRAMHQDIRPLEFALLNLMPRKQVTELQFARLLGHTPLQVNLTLLRVKTHTSKNESSEHLHKYYLTLDDVRDRAFDGLIVTGAPVEHLPWEAVDYWDELKDIFDWSTINAFMTIGICWGAQALLRHFHGIEKYSLPAKLSGLYPHVLSKNCESHTLLQGLDERFLIPVSRNTEVRKDDILRHPELSILLESPKSGLFVVQERSPDRLFIFNHPEYDAFTLQEEYDRDLKAHELAPASAPKPERPERYEGLNLWRSNGRTFYGNIVNDVYQRTPYRLEDIPALRKGN